MKYWPLGGLAEATQVDALDEKAINSCLNKIVQEAGHIDISYNAIGGQVVQNIPLTDIAVDDFMNPIHSTLRSQFVTATAVGKIMMAQGSGCDLISFRHARWYWLSVYRWLCTILRCPRKFFQKPGFRIRRLRGACC